MFYDESMVSRASSIYYESMRSPDTRVSFWKYALTCIKCFIMKECALTCIICFIMKMCAHVLHVFHESMCSHMHHIGSLPKHVLTCLCFSMEVCAHVHRMLNYGSKFSCASYVFWLTWKVFTPTCKLAVRGFHAKTEVHVHRSLFLIVLLWRT
jgi:hypothetical protein